MKIYRIANEYITKCCECKKIQDEQGNWIDKDVPDSLCTHAYCPECFEKAVNEISSSRNINPNEFHKNLKDITNRI